jgi:hypothetical protein
MSCCGEKPSKLSINIKQTIKNAQAQLPSPIIEMDDKDLTPLQRKVKKYLIKKKGTK